MSRATARAGGMLRHALSVRACVMCGYAVSYTVCVVGDEFVLVVCVVSCQRIEARRGGNGIVSRRRRCSV